MLKINELLWEITPKCNKNCSYCGSKDVAKNNPLKDDFLVRIAANIANYKNVGRVILTGGEPATLSDTLLNKILELFKAHNIPVRVLTNGLLFSKPSEIKDGFEVIGYSVNTLEDIQKTKPYLNIKPKITMITNFGLHNIWYFDELAECSRQFDNWQIQLTMGKYLLPDAGIKSLRDKIESLDNEIKNRLIIADNLQLAHECNAGMGYCSVTYLGEVIPCLSERSFKKPEEIKSEGNLLKTNLQEIWENGFKEIRFDCRKCCRDYIKYPVEEAKKPEWIFVKAKNDEEREPPKRWDDTPVPEISLYGVGTGVMAYAVGTFDNKTVPSCGRNRTWSGSDNIMSYCVGTKGD